MSSIESHWLQLILNVNAAGNTKLIMLKNEKVELFLIQLINKHFYYYIYILWVFVYMAQGLIL